MKKLIEINREDCKLAGNFNIWCPFKHFYDADKSVRYGRITEKFKCVYTRKRYPECQEVCDLEAIILVKCDGKHPSNNRRARSNRRRSR